MMKQIKAELQKILSQFQASEEGVDVIKVTDENIKISNKDVGGKVEGINPDGTLAEVENGTYTIGEGDNEFVFVVVDGLISEVLSEKQDEVVETELEDEKVDEPIEDKLAEKVAGLENKIADLESKIEDLVKANEDKEKENEAIANDFKKLSDVLAKFASIPAEQPKTNSKVTAKVEAEDKFKAFAQHFKK